MLLVHPGGPFWARRDLGSWSIAKGEVEDGEDHRAAARREFGEETGLTVPARTALIELGEARQPSRKVVVAYGAEIEIDPAAISSNLIEIAWPPRSGRTISIPEIDQAAWLDLEMARAKILPGQAVFLDRLAEALASRPQPDVRHRT